MNYQSSFNETSFSGQYANVNTLEISDNLTIGLTSIVDEEVTTLRTMGIPNSGTDGQFVITNGDVDQIIGGNNTFTGQNTFQQTTTFETDIKVDTINEYTPDHGVYIDSVLCKDAQLTAQAVFTDHMHERIDNNGIIFENSIYAGGDNQKDIGDPSRKFRDIYNYNTYSNYISTSQLYANEGHISDVYADNLIEKNSSIGLNLCSDLKMNADNENDIGDSTKMVKDVYAYRLNLKNDVDSVLPLSIKLDGSNEFISMVNPNPGGNPDFKESMLFFLDAGLGLPFIGATKVDNGTIVEQRTLITNPFVKARMNTDPVLKANFLFATDPDLGSTVVNYDGFYGLQDGTDLLEIGLCQGGNKKLYLDIPADRINITNGLNVDNINEHTLNNGVNIESMTIDGNTLYLDGKTNGKQYIDSSISEFGIINTDDIPINIYNTGNTSGYGGGITMQTDNSDIMIRTNDLYGNDTGINFKTTNNGVIQMDTLRLEVDKIIEWSTGAGVTVEGVKLQSGQIADTAYTTGILHSDGTGTITSSAIVNADVSNTAGIVYSKLNLGNSVQGSDIKTTTNITCNDLYATNNLQCDGIFTANEINTDIDTMNQLYVNTSAQMVFMGSGVVKSDGSGNLSSSTIVNADVSPSAGIALSKLASGTSGQLVVCNVSGVPTYVAMSGNVTMTNAGVTAIANNVITNVMINSAAAIAYSKLALSNSIVNADISSTAGIAYSKLALTNSVTNADLAGSIADTKLLTISTAGKVSNSATTATDANTASAIVARDASGNFSCGTVTSSGNLSASNGFVRANEGSAFGLQWSNSGIGNLSSIYSSNRNTFIFQMNGSTLYTFTNTGLTTSPYVSAGILKSTATTGAITSSAIVDADITSATITLGKLASGTSGQIIVCNGSGVPTYVGMTGNVGISNTGVTTIASNVITNAMINSSAAIADTKLATISTSGKVANSATTATLSATASTIVLRDASAGITCAQGRFTSLSLDGGTNSISGVMIQGSWTPTVTDATGNACTYTTRSGTYSRIGNRVWVNALIQINAKTALTATDTIRVGGLPYASVSNGNIGNWYYDTTSFVPPTNMIGMYTQVVSGQSYMTLGWQRIGGSRGALVSEMSTGAYFEFSCSYSV